MKGRLYNSWVSMLMLWQLLLWASPMTQTIHTCSMALQSPRSSVHFKVRESQHHNLPSYITTFTLGLANETNNTHLLNGLTESALKCPLQGKRITASTTIFPALEHGSAPTLWQLSLWAWPMTQTIHTCSMDLQSPLLSVHFKVRESQLAPQSSQPWNMGQHQHSGSFRSGPGQ